MNMLTSVFDLQNRAFTTVDHWKMEFLGCTEFSAYRSVSLAPPCFTVECSLPHF
ncbi:hypothetical protein I3843_15G060300 [Carya illinoinensis]|nr:hypothetical protein I3843_15G060300 [Carya illinoinensis]